MKITAICLAAGQGKRMESKVQKQYLLLKEKPVLYYSLKCFQESRVDEVILVVPSGEIEYCRKNIVEKYGFSKVKYVLEGGKERYHSVACGLKALSEMQDEPGIVLIHDGARPFVTPEMIHNLIEETEVYEACVIGTPVKDTIKIADEEGFCSQTPSRDKVWAVQTPQSFSFQLVNEAYTKVLQEEERLSEQGISITEVARTGTVALKKCCETK